MFYIRTHVFEYMYNQNFLKTLARDKKIIIYQLPHFKWRLEAININ
jgi:hypothetical protein